MKKKMLLIHNHNWEQFFNDKSTFIKGVTGIVQLCSNWQTQTYIRKWEEATPAECEGFEFVVMIVLPEQKPEKINKFAEIINAPGRTYKTIMYIPDVVGWQMNPFLPENKILYMDNLRNADYVMRFNLPESESYWKAVMSDKPSHFLERAYPVEMVEEIKSKASARAEKIIADNKLDMKAGYIMIDNGIKNINEERNTLCSLYVARKIQEQKGWGLVCFASNLLDPAVKDETYKRANGLENVTELPITEWITYMKVLSMLNIKIAIHLDCLETLGQVPRDCACLEIPLVCSGSVAGHRLYPYTWLDNCRNVDLATELAIKIISTGGFRRKVVNYAKMKVNTYSFSETKRKMEEILGVEL